MKNPVSVGIINALIPGLGYLLIKERVVFGWLTLIATLLYIVLMFVDPAPAFDAVLISVLPAGRIIESLMYLVVMAAFGYDTYDLRRKQSAAS